MAEAVKIDGGLLSPEIFASHWQSIERELDKHPEIWRDYYTKETLYEDIMEGEMQAWGFCEDEKIKIVVFTKIIDYPAVRSLQVLMALGNSLYRLFPYMEGLLERFALSQGCEMCEVIGRESWLKLLGPRFKKRAVVMTAYGGDVRVN